MSGAQQFIGTIAEIFEPENVGKKKPFFKRTFVVDDSTDERYPNPVPFELTRDKINAIDGFAVGDEVKVLYYLNGRAWEDPKTGKVRYFMSAAVFQIVKLEEDGANADPDAAAQDEGVDAGDTEDVPF